METLKHIDQPLENTRRRRAGHGHGHKDHGYQTRLDDHRERLTSGKSPSGRRGKSGNAPEQSAKFYSPEAELEALTKAEQQLPNKLQSDNISTMTDGQPTRTEVYVETNQPRGFGGGYRVKRDVNGAPIIGSDGVPQLEAVKKLKRAVVVFEYFPGRDKWVPVTYYPVID